METRHLPLRILYTINSSPQYILARSHSLVAATIIPRNSDVSHYDRSAYTPESSGLEPHCATTSLKTCLDTICRSSPELVQDFSRDFSVYVLDPLESNSAPAPVHISAASPPSPPQVSHTSRPTTNQPRGVAVGLGLMSWALLADEIDGNSVTGTLITLPTGKEALEVIFALRETATIRKASLPAALRSWGLPPQSSKLTRVHASKSHHESKHSPKQLTNNNGKLASPNLLSGENPETSLAQKPFPNTFHYPNMGGPSGSALPAYSSNDTPSPFSPSTLATLASIRMRTQTTKPLKSRKARATPVRPSEADKMMLTREIYIGPVKKKGRPAKGSTSMIDSETDLPGSFVDISESGVLDENSQVTVTDNRGSKIPAASNQSLSSTLNSEFSDPCTPILDPTIEPVDYQATRKHASQETSLSITSGPTSKLLDPATLLNTLIQLSTSPNSSLTQSQNIALLSTLSTIDAGRSDFQPESSGTVDNGPLINALRDLISMVSSQTAGSSMPNSPPRTLHNKSHSQDDEIIILDKENVNPSAFRRRAERDSKQINDDSPTSSGGPAGSPYPVSTPFVIQASPKRSLSLRSDEGRTPPALIPLQNNATSVNETRRKRTLSDFMDEREASRGGKSREREWAERRDAHRHAHTSSRNSSVDSVGSSMRHYSRLNTLDGLQRRDRSGTNSYYRTGMEPFTSPPRQTTSHRATFEGENTRFLATGTKSPRAMRGSFSSPLKPSSQAPKKKYVVPNWARTQTSTQPRLSKATQKALEDADERKRGEKDVKRKTACRSEKMKAKRAINTVNPSRQIAEGETSSQANFTSASSDNPQPPLPVAASDGCPIFSVASEVTLPIRTMTPELCLSGPPSSTTSITLPSTPPRKRPGIVHNLYNDKDSLFTPTPKSRSNGSPLFSPYQGLNSPLGTRIKRLALSRDNITIGNVGGWKSNHSQEVDNEDEEDLEDALGKELDSAFDELETSGSLSIADTDSEAGKGHRTTLDEAKSPTSLEDDEDQTDWDKNHVKQYWTGLPPSSPPPPTSPALMPLGVEADSDIRSEDDDDDTELPVATSDAEEYCSGSEVTGNHNLPDLLSYTNEELTAYLGSNDFSLLFPITDYPPLSNSSVSSDNDIFEQFTNLDTQSNSSRGDNMNMNVDHDLGNTLENQLADFDFTQFWETFKPLIQDHMNHNDNQSSSTTPQEAATGAHQYGEINHARLAQDVQTLFSGCLM